MTEYSFRWFVFCVGVVVLGGCDAPAGVQTKPARSQQVVSGGDIAMVAVAGGWFEMGSNDPEETDQPPHKVWVSPFLMDKFLVTQEQYEKLMGVNPSLAKSPRRPVDHIRWRDAIAFCNARSRQEGLAPVYDLEAETCNFDASGYRLPTEAEFEYALRAGTTSEYFFGDSPTRLGEYAWFKENSPRSPHDVGEKAPNPWGLYDMIGNIWEWCNDYYQEDYYLQSPERDPRGPATGEHRVVRGGCWNSKPGDCRSAYRNYEMPAFTDICFAKDVHGQLGFRCVKRP